MGFFAHLTLPDFISMTFGLIHFSGIQKCSLSHAFCSPMFILAHTHTLFGSLNYPPLCSKEAKYTEKASYMRKTVSNPSFSFSVPDNATREQAPHGQEAL